MKKELLFFGLRFSLRISNLLHGGKPAKANSVTPISDKADIRAVSFNLKCGGDGKNAISVRSPLLTAQLNAINADSVGVQEATPAWMAYLSRHLIGYSYVGVGRDDGKYGGEFSAVFYKKEKYSLLDSGTFWLSKHPDVPGSKDWDSKCTRICSYALLENKQTKQRYAHFNTHLDHVSSEARKNQMIFLLQKINDLSRGYPVVLTGDFNDIPDSEMYREAVKVFKDSRLCAPVTDNTGTFHLYGKVNPPRIIDYIFVSSPVSQLVYHVIDDKINGVYLSDHYGIYADLKLNNE